MNVSCLQALASVSVFVSWIKTRDEENKTEQRLGKLTSELNKFMQSMIYFVLYWLGRFQNVLLVPNGIIIVYYVIQKYRFTTT